MTETHQSVTAMLPAHARLEKTLATLARFTGPALRVYHDTVLSHHASARVAAMQIANTALFVFLRYPFSLWPLGLCQVLNNWLDTIRRLRFCGALLAAVYIPRHLWQYRRYRCTVSRNVILQQRRSQQG